MYSDDGVKRLLKEAAIERANPTDEKLVKLKPFNLRDSRDNLLESQLTVFAPTERDFAWLRRGLNASHRYHTKEGSRIFLNNEIMVNFLQKHKCAFVGGFVTSMLCETVYRDIDIMFYNSATYEQVMKAAKDLTQLLLNNNHQVRMVKTSNSLSIIVDAPFEYEEFQFVYRQFRNKADILYNMDLGSCQCMWDGVEFLGTRMARECLNYGVNIFDLSEWGPYKEERLVKYFNNGFAVVFPNLNYSMVSDEGDHELPYITLHTNYSESYHFVCGMIGAKELSIEDKQLRKEHFFGYMYEPHTGDVANTWNLDKIAYHNIIQSKKTAPSYVLYKNNISPEDVYESRITVDYDEIEFFSSMEEEGLDTEQRAFVTANWEDFNAQGIELIPELTTPDKYKRTVTAEEWYGYYSDSI